MDLKYLSLEAGWIRLAFLQPGKLDDRIHVLLEPVKLLPKPDRYFEALSYVWGAPDYGENIVVNGAETRAGKNLNSALRRLRFTNRVR